jgi:hypothetical protein
MIEVVHNPINIESTYIEGLNSSFGLWGGIELYKWCFHRRIGDLNADVLVLKKNREIIAGSGVTYRKVLLSNGFTTNVGIMTGSWTLPHARGQGCFTKIIEESVRFASDKGAAFLLAFVTEKNASFRRLRSAGSALFPTYYMSSEHNIPVLKSAHKIVPFSNTGGEVSTILEKLGKEQSDTSHFIYTEKEWVSQFLSRPGNIEFLSIEDIGFTVIETKGEFDRVLFTSLKDKALFGDYLRSLLQRSINNGRKLLIFTTDGNWTQDCVTLGMNRSMGYLTTLVASERELASIYGCPPAVTKEFYKNLYNSSSQWNIGPWNVQPGDRM